MKKILHLSLLALFFFSSCTNEVKDDMEIGQYTTIEYKEVYDMGRVTKGEIIDVAIEIKNTGKYPLVIADIEPACSCTVPEYEEDPISPGETTTIIAHVDTEKTGRGKISKPINITANTRPSTTVITIKATVN